VSAGSRRTRRRRDCGAVVTSGEVTRCLSDGRPHDRRRVTWSAAVVRNCPRRPAVHELSDRSDCQLQSCQINQRGTMRPPFGSPRRPFMKTPPFTSGARFSLALLLLSTLLVANGCSGDSSGDRVDDSLLTAPSSSAAAMALPGIDSAGIRVITVSRDSMLGLPQWTLQASQPVIGVGRNEPEYLLNRPGLPWRLSDGRIIVSTDATSFRIYDARGVHLRSVGQYGEGPEDFQGNLNVRADAQDSLLIMDGAFQRVNVYTAAGDFVRQFSVRSLGIGPFGPKWIGSSKLVVGLAPANASLTAPQPTITRDTLHIVLRNVDGSNVDTVGRIPRAWSRRSPLGTGSVPFTGQPQLGTGMRSFATSEPESFRINWYDDSGRLICIIRAPDVLNPIPPDSILAFETRMASRSEYWS
jgi:hypothetical protein